MAPEHGPVLVTGASSGIGAATVDALVRSGHSVWATVRHLDDAQQLTARHGASVRPLLMDLTDHESVQAAGVAVRRAGPLRALINNAGAASAGPLETLPLEALREQLEVNLVGQLAVTQAMLPALRAATRTGGDARIVMVGSIGGRVSMPMLGAYAASKHALAGMTGSLAAELRPSDIRVVLVEPGATATPIWGRGTIAAERGGAHNDVDHPADPTGRYTAMMRIAEDRARRSSQHGMPPAVVAAAILDAITRRHPAPRRLVGRSATLLAAAERYLPDRLVDHLLAGGG